MNLSDGFQPIADSTGIEFRLRGLGVGKRPNPIPALLAGAGAGLFAAAPAGLFLLGPTGPEYTPMVLGIAAALTALGVAVAWFRDARSGPQQHIEEREVRIDHVGVTVDGVSRPWTDIEGLRLDKTLPDDLGAPSPRQCLVVDSPTGELRASVDLHTLAECNELERLLEAALAQFGARREDVDDAHRQLEPIRQRSRARGPGQKA